MFNHNWLKVFRLREIFVGVSPIIIASLDFHKFLDPVRFLILVGGFYAIFISSFLINELVDSFDTDQFNPEREKGITKHGVSRQFTLVAFVSWSIVGILLLSLLGLVWIALTGFLLLFLYSVPPVRIKARPFFDLVAVTLGFVIFPYLSFSILVAQNPSIPVGLILAFFASGFMAIDLVAEGADFDADKKAGLQTTAVFLGEKKNLQAIQFLSLISTILGAVAIIITGHWWYLYLIAMTFFLFTASRFGLSIVGQKERLHELLRTGERFGIFVSGLGTVIAIIIFICASVWPF
jgi:4-hydroxybenzoate polyprenyltransferase